MSEHVITARATANEWGNRRWIATCSCGWVAGAAMKKETKAVWAGNNSHLKHQKPDCPTPHKQRFKSQPKAEKALDLFWRTAGKGKAMPTRVYQCPCGGWHTTSKPARPFASAGGRNG